MNCFKEQIKKNKNNHVCLFVFFFFFRLREKIILFDFVKLDIL